MSQQNPSGRRQRNLSDPRTSYCLDEESEGGARPLDFEDLKRRENDPYACELQELDLSRGIALRLRTELIYGYPTVAGDYTEENVPTSRNMPMLMEFLFEVLTGKKDPGPGTE